MVRIGFICEGKTERKIIESGAFQSLLNSLSIECVFPVIDAKGSGNLLPENILDFKKELLSNDAEKIIIVTDLDVDTCITKTKKRIGVYENEFIVVAIQQVEAWFLADTETLSKLLSRKFIFEFPENEKNPFETMRNIFLQTNNRGVGNKDILAQRMLKYGFSIENAANHPNCPSARYFIEKLKSVDQK